jgi:hypothetical protein
MPSEKQDDTKPAGFKVSDRRSFSESGEPKPAPAAGTHPSSTSASASTAGTGDPPAADSPALPTGASDPPSAAPAGSPPPAPRATDQPGTRSATSERNLPPVDFHTFILSLGSSALLNLGELDQPDGTESHPDLPLAKHTIDIIAMLQTKTKGNLSPPEERLVESLLYDLRLRFVERSKNQSGG